MGRKPTGAKALTAKERAQRGRDKVKNDPHLREQYLIAEKARYREQLETGSRKLVADMSSREQRKARRAWRVSAKLHRYRKNKNEAAIEAVGTPPATPENNNPEPNNIGHIPVPANGMPPTTPHATESGNDKQKRGRKNVRRDRAKAYRTIETLKVKLLSSDKNSARHRKRVQRLKEKVKELSHQSQSPRAEAMKILKKGSPEVRRRLILSNSVISGLTQKYKSAATIKEKVTIRKLFRNSYLKKYGLVSELSMTTGINRKMLRDREIKPRHGGRIKAKVRKSVVEFLLRDDNSTMKPGKKDTITRKKAKKQKRILNDTMLNLHRKFLSETRHEISYASFCRLRPFWVVEPQLSDRDTCRCKIHDNMFFMADRLKTMKLVNDSNPENLANDFTCSTDKKNCMYRTCQECVGKKVTLLTSEYDPNLMTFYYSWETITVDWQNKSGENETTKKTVKIRIESTLQELIDDFNAIMTHKFTKNIYNIRHQYSEMRHLKSTMKDNEVLLHIDFSENWTCKYHNEIQSCHFGASNSQITIHTVAMYTNGNQKPLITISDNRCHDAGAFWAHLRPVLEWIRSGYPNVDTLHVLSDGPTSQYRNKDNFFLLSHIPFEMNFKIVEWSFLEAGHGKGAADGLGGSIKRTADRFVCNGMDIPDAQSLFNALAKHESKMMVFMVTDDDIAKTKDVLQRYRNIIKPIDGTMSLHQVMCEQDHIVKYRILTCTRCPGIICNCHGVKERNFIDDGSATEVTNGLSDADANIKGNDRKSFVPQALGKFEHYVLFVSCHFYHQNCTVIFLLSCFL